MNHTQNYQLNQWEPGDPVLHTDFNADNRKIEAALKELSAGLTAANAGLGGKMGRSEILQTYSSSGGTDFGITTEPPCTDWNDYEYVCVLVAYPDSLSGVTPTLNIMGNNTAGRYTEQLLPPLALPGYLIVFLPWHNAKRKTSGFVIADRLIPFTTDIPFKSLQCLEYSNQNRIITPDYSITAFGGK